MAGLACSTAYGRTAFKRTGTEELCRYRSVLLVLSGNGHVVDECLAAVMNRALCAVFVATGSVEGDIDGLLGDGQIEERKATRSLGIIGNNKTVRGSIPRQADHLVFVEVAGGVLCTCILCLLGKVNRSGSCTSNILAAYTEAEVLSFLIHD